jgi:hypothetical protein
MNDIMYTASVLKIGNILYQFLKDLNITPIKNTLLKMTPCKYIHERFVMKSSSKQKYCVFINKKIYTLAHTFFT